MAVHLQNRRNFIKNFSTGMVAIQLPLLVHSRSKTQTELQWYNVEEWGIEGKGWNNTKRYFDRLPAKAEGMVREPVWNLSRHSAGMTVRFITDAQNIHVRYDLLLKNLAMNHMPATGVSGIDLYAEDGQGVERWVSVVRPNEIKIEQSIAKNLAPGKRQYTMYLPLYNGVNSLEIGVEVESIFETVAPRKEKPMLFYGTSILHGACASRPGLAFPSILSRRFKRPILNLGFSGNGRMESEVGALLAEQDPCVFVIDCLPNMNENTVTERTIPLVKQLKSSHPKTPILLVEDRSFTNTPFFPQRKEHHKKSRLALNHAYRNLLSSGIDELYYLSGDHLLGLDGEAATDGSHPNDLGMMRYANAYEPVLRQILKQY